MSMEQASEQLKHLERMRETIRRNVHRLEEQAAGYGLAVPLPLANELDAARADLEQVELALQSPVTLQTAQALGSEGRFIALGAQLQSITELLQGIGEQLRREHDDRQLWQATDQAQRAARVEQQDTQRARDRTLLVRLGVGLVVALFLAMGAITALAVAVTILVHN